MKNRLLEFFSESNGQLSNLRLNTSLVTVTICFCFVWLTVVLKFNLEVSFVFLLAIAMTGKVAQKYAENKSDAATRSSSQTAQPAGIETNETTEEVK